MLIVNKLIGWTWALNTTKVSPRIRLLIAAWPRATLVASTVTSVAEIVIPPDGSKFRPLAVAGGDGDGAGPVVKRDRLAPGGRDGDGLRLAEVYRTTALRRDFESVGRPSSRSGGSGAPT